jgi:multimeric flavodoxin WrbA
MVAFACICAALSCVAAPICRGEFSHRQMGSERFFVHPSASSLRGIRSAGPHYGLIRRSQPILQRRAPNRSKNVTPIKFGRDLAIHQSNTCALPLKAAKLHFEGKKNTNEAQISSLFAALLRALKVRRLILLPRHRSYKPGIIFCDTGAGAAVFGARLLRTKSSMKRAEFGEFNGVKIIASDLAQGCTTSLLRFANCAVSVSDLLKMHAILCVLRAWRGGRQALLTPIGQRNRVRTRLARSLLPDQALQQIRQAIHATAFVANLEIQVTQLKAITLNCSLKRSHGRSSTARLLDEVCDELKLHDVECDAARIADLNILPGVSSNEGPGDDWPGLRRRILAADILVFGTPIWMGHPSSFAQRICERMDAFLDETDAAERTPAYGKVAICAIVGNEDGAHAVSAALFQGLNDVGFTIPAAAVTYWVGEAMGDKNYVELDHTPRKIAAATKQMVANAVHLAALLSVEAYAGKP